MPVLRERPDGSWEKVKLEGEVGPVSSYGISFPASPDPGWLFFRTDLDCQFYYDSTREKWLGTDLEFVEASYNGVLTQGNFPLLAGGVPMTSAVGPFIFHDSTVVGLTYIMDSLVSGDFEVLREGSVVATISYSAAVSGAEDLNDDFSGDGILAVRNKAGSEGPTTPYIRVYWRRRAV